MIISDPTREIPSDWTDERIVELFDHARDLAHNGNPGGYMLTVVLDPFITDTVEERRVIRPFLSWDYDGIRRWIAENEERIAAIWRFRVVHPS